VYGNCWLSNSRLSFLSGATSGIRNARSLSAIEWLWMGAKVKLGGHLTAISVCPAYVEFLARRFFGIQERPQPLHLRATAHGN